MKKLLKKYWVYALFLLVTFLIFKPLVTSSQIPFSSNLLVSFFNPWVEEKFPDWIQGIPNKPVGIDDLRIFYPQRVFTTSSFKNFQIPFWNPYNFSGNFHAGLSETAVFYPLFFLFLFIPQLPAWVVLQVIEVLVAAIGMYLFLKLIIKSKISSAFGAIVFGFSGLVIVRMVEGLSVGHTLIWLPLALYGLESFSQIRKARYLLITISALILSLLAGWFQFTFYTIFITFFYTLFKSISIKGKERFLLFTPFLFLPLLTLFHIIPSLGALQVSSRSETTLQTLLNLHLMPWYHVLTFLSPDLWGNPGSYNFFGKSEYKESILYIGTVPFIISLFSVSNIKDKRVLFFTILALVGIMLGTDTPISRAILSIPLPIVSSFLPNRIFLFTTFGLSVLSSFGFSYLLETKKFSKRYVSFVMVVTGILLVLMNGYVFALVQAPGMVTRIHLGNLYNIMQKNTLILTSFHFTASDYQTSIFARNILLPDILIILFLISLTLRNLARKRILIIVIFSLTIFPQLYFAQKYIPWSEIQFVFPKNDVFTYLQKNQGFDRFITSGKGYISSNIPLFFGLYSPDGVGSMYIKRYGELISFTQNKGTIENVPRIEIRINPASKTIFSDADPYLTRFMQIDGIKYVLKLKQENNDPEGFVTNGTNEFPLVWQNDTWQIFKNTNVLPRAFWTNQYIVKTNQNEDLRSVFDFSADPKRIVLEEKPKIMVDGSATGSVQVLTYSPQKIILISKADSNGFIFLSDNYSSNFSAFVDGKKGQLLRADYTFRAIPVAKGTHTVIVEYKDNKELAAWIISVGSILGFLLGIYLLRRKIDW